MLALVISVKGVLCSVSKEFHRFLEVAKLSLNSVYSIMEFVFRALYLSSSDLMLKDHLKIKCSILNAIRLSKNKTSGDFSR